MPLGRCGIILTYESHPALTLSARQVNKMPLGRCGIILTYELYPALTLFNSNLTLNLKANNMPFQSRKNQQVSIMPMRQESALQALKMPDQKGKKSPICTECGNF
jgi:hypothetical protein